MAVESFFISYLFVFNHLLYNLVTLIFFRVNIQAFLFFGTALSLLLCCLAVLQYTEDYKIKGRLLDPFIVFFFFFSFFFVRQVVLIFFSCYLSLMNIAVLPRVLLYLIGWLQLTFIV